MVRMVWMCKMVVRACVYVVWLVVVVRALDAFVTLIYELDPPAFC